MALVATESRGRFFPLRLVEKNTWESDWDLKGEYN